MIKIFTTNAQERLGFLLLFFLTLSGLSAGQLLQSRKPPAPDSMEVADWEKAVGQLLAEPERPAPGQDSLFPFDPNQIAFKDWLRLGLTKELAARIEKYKASGGRFRRVEDLNRIYGLSQADFERLRPYIRLPRSASSEKPRPAVKRPAPFDPNTVSREELVVMGLDARPAATWCKFREAVGGFSSLEQIERIYGLDQDWWARWKPFARLEHPSETREDDVGSPHRVDINQADAAEWQKLYGIGPVLSERIVRFRDKLGGFFRVEQVGETYGLPDSTFLAVRSRLIVSDSVELRTIDLNGADAYELAAHPYLSRKQAQVIVSYRQHHGPFAQPAEVGKTMVFSASGLDRILPYLQVENLDSLREVATPEPPDE